MKNIPKIFDKAYIKSIRTKTLPLLPPFDFLHYEINERLIERLKEFNRSFDTVLIIGSKSSNLFDYLENNNNFQNITIMDFGHLKKHEKYNFIQGDEENLPFAPGSFDLILSSTHLHMTNDFPGALKQFHTSLKKNGVFIGSLFGGETLMELKESFYKAEMSLTQKIFPHIMPMIEVKQLGDLLKRAGFELSLSTEDRLEVTYSHPINLLRDLKKMGESNTMIQRSRQFLSKRVFDSMCYNYVNDFSIEDNKILATFDVLIGSGVKI
ncbi:MAG: class I SAM-dependent methyltransferase [Alphaproteobacteria bacterium]|nr:class I SAM-dependent methyltransferase [Alphaproteobacteria bacterium]